jgi:hypothetical protein
MVGAATPVEAPRCSWCRRPLPAPSGPGRPRQFCSRSHRQRAYEARRRAESLNLPEGQVVVTQGELQRLHDRLYRLEAALEDVDADLAGQPSAPAYRQAFEHLYEAAKDVAGVVIEPATE